MTCHRSRASITIAQELVLRRTWTHLLMTQAGQGPVHPQATRSRRRYLWHRIFREHASDVVSPFGVRECVRKCLEC